MQLSVIILNYNVRFFLEQCIFSVQKALQEIDGEIIVVDNASKDDSMAMLKEKFPDVVLIENKENLGFPKGNNIGVAAAKGEYICILNPDTVLAEDTFAKIFNSQHITHNLQLGIIGCKLIDGTGNFLPESKRGIPSPWVAFTKIFGLYKWFPKWKFVNQYYAQHLSENQNGEVAILVGAFMFMKRDLYIQVGGFDENCFMYSDDIDLSYTVKKMGYFNYYFSETTVIHYKGESTVRDALYLKRFSDAMNFFYTKHFRKSFFFDVFMKLGSFLFVKLKQSKQTNKKRNIDEYVVFTKSNLQLEFSKSISYYSHFDDFKDDSKQTEIIFDTSSFTFKEIIAFMEKNKTKNYTFKNYFPQAFFAIGSNNANDRGEVLQF
jgi:GT2 family glycosyltransferase